MAPSRPIPLIFTPPYAEEAVRIDGNFTTAPAGANKMLVTRQPVGVALLITPWNFPAAIATRTWGPAIAAGCPTILKLAADNVVNTSMELGGNAPFLVFADADLDAAVDGAMLAKLRNGGEACTAANRFYVEKSVAMPFAEKLAEKMRTMSMGRGDEDGVKLGPLVNEATVDKVDRLVQEAVSRGARALIGGQRPDGDRFFFPATVLVDVPDDAMLARGDRRTGRSDHHVHLRSRSRAEGQRHPVRTRLLPLHRRPRPRIAGQCSPGIRDGRHQSWSGQRSGGAVSAENSAA